MFVYKSESEFCYIHGAIKNCILSAAPVIAEFWFSEHKRALFLIFSHFFFFFFPRTGVCWNICIQWL